MAVVPTVSGVRTHRKGRFAMKRTQRSRRHRGTLAATFAGLLAATTMLGGCNNRAHTGALIGAGVGAGVGYMIGSDYEKVGRPHGHGH